MASVEEISSEDIGFKLCTSSDGIVLFDEPFDYDGEVAGQIELLAIGSLSGYFACSNATTLIVDKLDKLNGDSVNELFKIEGLTKISQVCFCCDESTLYVVIDGRLKYINMNDLKSNNALEGRMLQDFIPSSGGNLSKVRKVQVSPSDPELLGVLNCQDELQCIYKGKLSTLSKGISLFAWSLDNKHFFVFSKDTEGIRLISAEDGGVVRRLELPEEASDESFDIVNITELESWKKVLVSLCMGDPSEGDYKTFVGFMSDTDIQFSEVDIASPFGSTDRPGTYYLTYLNEWSKKYSLTFITSSKATEINLLCIDDEDNLSCVGQLNDYDRAQMPIDDETGDDSSPLGIAIDLSCLKVEVKEPCNGIETAKGLPRIWALTNEGALISWWVFDIHGLKSSDVSLLRARDYLAKKVQTQAVTSSSNDDMTIKMDEMSTNDSSVSHEDNKEKSMPLESTLNKANSDSLSDHFSGSTESSNTGPFNPSSGSTEKEKLESASVSSSEKSASSLQSFPFGSPVVNNSSEGLGTNGEEESSESVSSSMAKLSSRATPGPAFGSTGFGNSSFLKSASAPVEDDKVPMSSTTGFGKYASTTSNTPAFGASGFGSTSFSQSSSKPDETNKPLVSGFGKYASSSEAPAFGSSGFGNTSFSQSSSKSDEASKPLGSGFGKYAPKTSENPTFGSTGFGNTSFSNSNSKAEEASKPLASGFGKYASTTSKTPAFGASGFGSTSFSQSGSKPDETNKPLISGFGKYASSSEASTFGSTGFGNTPFPQSDSKSDEANKPSVSGFGKYASTTSKAPTFGSTGFGNTSIPEPSSKPDESSKPSVSGFGKYASTNSQVPPLGSSGFGSSLFSKSGSEPVDSNKITQSLTSGFGKYSLAEAQPSSLASKVSNETSFSNLMSKNKGSDLFSQKKNNDSGALISDHIKKSDESPFSVLTKANNEKASKSDSNIGENVGGIGSGLEKVSLSEQGQNKTLFANASKSSKSNFGDFSQDKAAVGGDAFRKILDEKNNLTNGENNTDVSKTFNEEESSRIGNITQGTITDKQPKLTNSESFAPKDASNESQIKQEELESEKNILNQDSVYKKDILLDRAASPPLQSENKREESLGRGSVDKSFSGASVNDLVNKFQSTADISHQNPSIARQKSLSSLKNLSKATEVSSSEENGSDEGIPTSKLDIEEFTDTPIKSDREVSKTDSIFDLKQEEPTDSKLDVTKGSSSKDIMQPENEAPKPLLASNLREFQLLKYDGLTVTEKQQNSVSGEMNHILHETDGFLKILSLNVTIIGDILKSEENSNGKINELFTYPEMAKLSACEKLLVSVRDISSSVSSSLENKKIISNRINSILASIETNEVSRTNIDKLLSQLYSYTSPDFTKHVRQRPLSFEQSQMRLKLRTKIDHVLSLEKELISKMMPLKARSSSTHSVLRNVEKLIFQINECIYEHVDSIGLLSESLHNLRINEKEMIKYNPSENYKTDNFLPRRKNQLSTSFNRKYIEPVKVELLNR